MSFVKFSAGNLIKSNEVNYNMSITLPTANAVCDLALKDTTTIDVMDSIDTPFKIVDLFTDANGDNDTVDTTNTTAEYNFTTLSYNSKLPVSDIVLEPGFETVSNWTGSVVSAGYGSYGQSTTWKTEGTYSYKLTGEGFTGSVTAGALVTQTNVDFTNIDYLVFDYNLYTPTSGSGMYYIGSFAIGDTSVTLPANTTGTYTYDCSAITGTANLVFSLLIEDSKGFPAQGVLYIDNIRTFTGTEYLDSIIQSVSKSVGTGYNYAYVRPKLYEAIPSGATITCEVSLDGGSTFSAESDINEIIDLSGLTDTGNLVVKLNLNTDGTVTSKVSGWACLLYK